MNVFDRIIAAFCNDIRLALTFDPVMRYVPLTYNQVFFRTIRVAIMGAACIYAVMFTLVAISYVAAHPSAVAQFLFWAKML